jgi:hypothetical protein
MVYWQTSEHIDAAGSRGVSFVLNVGDIDTHQDIKVVGSYRSPRSFTGDHFDSYCIQISRFDLSNAAEKYWREGPEANTILLDALELGVNDAHDHASCFPTFAEANSSAMKIRFASVVVNDGQATAADIVLYAPKTKMLYYVSFKT